MALSIDQLGLDDGAQLALRLRRHYVDLLRRAFGDASQQLDMDLAFDLDNPRVQEVLDQLLARAKGMAETTKSDVQALIGQADAEGWSVERLAEALRTKGAASSATRSIIIATTERATASSLGAMLAYEDAGVTRIEWLTAEDELVCPICGPLNGKIVQIGQEFAPGIRSPSAHPNCRCAILPVVE